jgi:hypothetical protein
MMLENRIFGQDNRYNRRWNQGNNRNPLRCKRSLSLGGVRFFLNSADEQVL